MSGGPGGREGDVIVVGAGPTGLTLACLLADEGLTVRVVEAQGSASDEPRAIAFADESLRTAHALRILDDMRADIVWNSGTRYLGAREQLLARVKPPAARIGFPVKTLFDQPGYVRALLAGVSRRPGVHILWRSRVTGLRQDDAGVTLSLQTAGGAGGDDSVRAQYVVGCDGGRSAVREAIGVRMAGSTQTHPWIVIDTTEDPRDDSDTEFHCWPGRPNVVVPGTDGRCRYEFMLLPGERSDDVLTPASIVELVRPYRDLDPGQIRRSAVYVGRQLVAERWASGRVFLAGDAAHLMPPFAGQGLNTGLRDVRNLAWKLGSVLRREADPALLDTYEQERRPHTTAMVRFSVRLGGLIMTAHPVRAHARDLALQALRLVPPVRRYLAELRFVPRPVYLRGCIAGPPPPRRSPGLRGRPLPQGQVIGADSRMALLDDHLGVGWSLVAVAPSQAGAFADLQLRTGLLADLRRVVVLPPNRIPRTDADKSVGAVAELTAMLHPSPAGRFLLVRPDRYVAADFTAEQQSAVVADLSPYLERAAHTVTPVAESA